MNKSASLNIPKKSFFQQHGQKLLAFVFWLALIGAYQWYAYSRNLTALQVMQNLLAFLQNGLWGPLAYIALYAVRPLVLFPATLLTLAGGFVFGPVWGIVYTVIASNTSATVAYLVGRYFGQDMLEDGASDSIIQRYAARMRENSFETIMIMRFIFLPYDLVNYLGGFLRIRWTSFILATALGSIPGTMAFVWFGASIEQFDGGLPSLNPVTLAASVSIFIISLALSRVFKKRERIAK